MRSNNAGEKEMQKLNEFIKPKTAAHHLYPKIDLSACRSCGGNGYRLINGIRWNCFSCTGSGTIVQHGGRVTA